MDVDKALDLMWSAAARSSQGRVAKEIGVQPSALSRWKAGERPEGDNRQRLIEWAERQPARVAEPVASYASDAITRLVRQGQAEQAAWVQAFVVRILEAQTDLVRSLSLAPPQPMMDDDLSIIVPPVTAASESLRARVEQDVASRQEQAAQDAQTPAPTVRPAVVQTRGRVARGVAARDASRGR